MNFKHLLKIVCFLALSACKPAGKQAVGADYSINVTDFRGKVIALEKPATRIVCLIESALSGLYMLGAEHLVIGVPSSVYFESTAEQYAALDDRIKNKTLPSPGNWDFVSLESLVALQPDLVIIWSSQQESIQAIEDKGIPVYGIFLNSFEDVYKEMADLGKLTGTSLRADSLIEYTRQEIKTLQETTNLEKQKSVYFIWPQGLLNTSGTNSTVNDLIELAGATNACQHSQEHLVVNMENLLKWNPDVMLMWNNNAKNPEDFLGLPELKNVNAIKNNQVFELPSAFWCDLWTLKYQLAVKILTKHCYPETFEHLNIEAAQQEMALNLYGSKGERLQK